MLSATVLGYGIPSAGGQAADDLCDPGDGVQFDDVAATDYGAGYIVCARALGLTKGRADGSYGPDQNLTRTQMAAFLARLWRDVLGRDCPVGSHPFTDVPDSHYASADIGCLYLLGITKGASPDVYAPSATLTVSQLTRFLIRMVNKITPGSCDTSGNELTAAACMAVLNSAPSTAEAESSSKATRAQMAVYLIGAWHHVAKPDAPPQPPARPTDATTAPTVTTTTIPAESTVVLPVVSAGGSHSCGVSVDRSVVCWGKNQCGQTDAPEGAFKTVTAGNFHSCGQRADRTLECWGYNQAGRAAPPPGEFASVSAGNIHTCGVRVDRTLACWGNNHRGQTNAPEGKFADISAGGAHTCAVTVGDAITCWAPGGMRRRPAAHSGPSLLVKCTPAA